MGIGGNGFGNEMSFAYYAMIWLDNAYVTTGHEPYKTKKHEIKGEIADDAGCFWSAGKCKDEYLELVSHVTNFTNFHSDPQDDPAASYKKQLAMVPYDKSGDAFSAAINTLASGLMIFVFGGWIGVILVFWNLWAVVFGWLWPFALLTLLCLAADSPVMRWNPASGVYEQALLREVRVGDEVMVTDPLLGGDVFRSRVYFAHCDEGSHPLVRLTVESGQSINAVPPHLVAVVDDSSSVTFRSAESVQIGDKLVVSHDGQPTQPEAVRSIEYSLGGICDVKTEAGVILGDGVLASNAVTDHDAAMMAWAPIKTLSRAHPDFVARHAWLISRTSEVATTLGYLALHGQFLPLTRLRSVIKASHSQPAAHKMAAVVSSLVHTEL